MFSGRQTLRPQGPRAGGLPGSALGSSPWEGRGKQDGKEGKVGWQSGGKVRFRRIILGNPFGHKCNACSDLKKKTFISVSHFSISSEFRRRQEDILLV